MSLSDDRSFTGFEGLLSEMSAVIHGQNIALGIADIVGIYPGGPIGEAGLHDLDHAVASRIVAELQGGIAIVKFDPLDLVAVVPEDFLDVALGVCYQVADFVIIVVACILVSQVIAAAAQGVIYKVEAVGGVAPYDQIAVVKLVDLRSAFVIAIQGEQVAVFVVAVIGSVAVGADSSARPVVVGLNIGVLEGSHLSDAVELIVVVECQLLRQRRSGLIPQGGLHQGDVAVEEGAFVLPTAGKGRIDSRRISLKVVEPGIDGLVVAVEVAQGKAKGILRDFLVYAFLMETILLDSFFFGVWF